MDALVQDLRGAIRQCARAPVFTAAIVVVLGLGIGGALAVFGLFDALTLRKISAWRPDELVAVTPVDTTTEAMGLGMPARAFDRLAATPGLFTAATGYVGETFPGSGGGARWSISVDFVTSRYFEVLGLRPQAGRFFAARESASGEREAVITDGFWQRRLGANPQAVGSTLELPNASFVIVGIAPAGFAGLEVGEPSDVMVRASAFPRVAHVQDDYPSVGWLVGRLAPGVTIERADRELTAQWPLAIRDAIPAWLPADERESFLKSRLDVASAATGVSVLERATYARPLALLALCSALAICLVCANISTLLLARSAVRERELSVRAALGASRARLALHAWGECVLLSVAGTALGLPIAFWTMKTIALMMWFHPDVPPLDFSPDRWMVAAIVASAIGAGLLSGLLPAYRATRSDLVTAIRSTGAVAARTSRWGRRMVVAQVALASMLVVVGYLVSANLRRLLVAPGFAAAGVAGVDLEEQPGGYAGYPDHFDAAAYCRRIVDLISTVPGVDAAALAAGVPLGGADHSEQRPVGLSGTSAGGDVDAFYFPVSPAFFRVLGMSLTRGREFASFDDAGHGRVAIVSDTLAKWLSDRGDAVGRRVHIGPADDRVDAEIVGVVSDSRLLDLRVPSQRIVFVPLLQQTPNYMRSPEIFMRLRAPLESVVGELRRRVEALGQDYVDREVTMSEIVSASVLRERLMTIGANFFAGLGTVIVAAGLIGVCSYNVERRTREIGLRAALGASRASLQAMILREAVGVVAAGVLIGLIGAWLTTRMLSSVLTQIDPRSPAAFAGGAGIVMAAALLSAWIPARRASAITPMEALRGE